MRAYGFVPNGLRTYYLGRSQPPLLTQMVAAVIDGGEAPLVAAAQSSNPAASPVDACQHEGVSTELLLEALPLLDRECTDPSTELVGCSYYLAISPPPLPHLPYACRHR